MRACSRAFRSSAKATASRTSGWRRLMISSRGGRNRSSWRSSRGWLIGLPRQRISPSKESRTAHIGNPKPQENPHAHPAFLQNRLLAQIKSSRSINRFRILHGRQLNFSFIRDIAPVAGIIVVPNVMLVNPSVPAKTLPEFIAYAKANPGKINIASGPIGGPSHVTAELFKMMTGTDMLLVSYRGVAPAATDLLGGQVQVMFNSLPASIEYIRAGTLRALAVTSATRSETLPGIPAMGEFVPGFEASQWYGVGAPKNTPPQIIEKLNKEINADLANPKLKAQLSSLGGTALPGLPADFGKLVADETEKWGKVIRAANIKAE